MKLSGFRLSNPRERSRLQHFKRSLNFANQWPYALDIIRLYDQNDYRTRQPALLVFDASVVRDHGVEMLPGGFGQKLPIADSAPIHVRGCENLVPL